jgi:hypothetical protein
MTSDATAKDESSKKSSSTGDQNSKPGVVSADLVDKLQNLAKPTLDLLCLAIPFLIKAGRKFHHYWTKCDDNVLAAFLGFVFCFFGGLYPTLFSAIQAAEQGGRVTLVYAMRDLSDEAAVIIEESKKDDKVDADGDGIADVDQIDNKEYVHRKTLLVLRKMNPQKVDKALNSIYTVWLSVMAVLSIQFARTIQMANSIAEFMQQPVNRFVAPIVKAATPDQYGKFCSVILCSSVNQHLFLSWFLSSLFFIFVAFDVIVAYHLLFLDC